MKSFNISIGFLVGIFLVACSNQTNFDLSAGSFRMILNAQGNVVGFENSLNGQDYHFKDTLSPVMTVWKNGEVLSPQAAIFDAAQGNLVLDYPQEIQANIKVQEKETHLTLELISLTDSEAVDLILWGPYPTTIRGVIGETVGVVRDEVYAIGIQSLNPRTLGGYPWNDNDAMPQIDIFEGGDFSDMNEVGKREVLYRVEAAKPTDFGSTLQAYTRNRNKERIIENWGKERYVAPAFEDGGVIGSKIALFGSPESAALEIIGKIELAEGLPHPIIDGKWGKMARTASAAYMILAFNEKNIDQAIKYTKNAGLRYLYHPGPFENWGHFDLNEGFPNGREGMKTIVDKAKNKGVLVGVHTLSNFITTNDPYVTPIPDERLAKVGSSVLNENIDTSQKEIPITSPDFFNELENNNLKTAQVGSELIRYGSVSKQAPWMLLDCQRGAYGTEVSIHEKGVKISLLADHGYKVFLTTPGLGDEMARNIADLFNETGLRQISFDGVEGNRSTGMGNYGEILFTNAWYDYLSEDIKTHFIADASRTSHYFWHIYSRMNWGEPWYAGFRESQTEYRLKNQKYFQRNYMPGMLGWFSMHPTTSIEDIEWMLARSAAFNAGYAFVVNIEALEKNGYTNEILDAIGEWEKARMANVFTEEQRKMMEDINNEFHLETKGENQWNLNQVISYKFKHEKNIRQPGEPLYSVFEFENNTGENTMQFILTAVDADLSNIILELDNYKKINFPIGLKAGQSLKYEGGELATLYNENWQKIGEVKMIEPDLMISDGSHAINFECTFSQGGKSPLAKLEVRFDGPAQELTK
ncbi:MAG: hypothetical protein O2887_05460 [Bacteroidetes bacterium]|nr:hypothetical protein [Bacteroidota bacterium]MDA1119929.1 hypothetical protein [Bacteroidota bacterium]